MYTKKVMISIHYVYVKYTLSINLQNGLVEIYTTEWISILLIFVHMLDIVEARETKHLVLYEHL